MKATQNLNLQITPKLQMHQGNDVENFNSKYLPLLWILKGDATFELIN